MNLQKLETRLQNLVEVELLKILPGGNVEDIVIQKLAGSIQHNMHVTKNKALPDVYTLVMHPSTAENWVDEKLLAVVLHSITAVAQESGFKFTIPPIITVKIDETIQKDDVEILTSFRMEKMAETNATTPPLETGELQNRAEGLPENCFLIVEGVKVFPLSAPVVNIGRRLDNQLVIDDPRVSRNHAQLRSIKGRFVVFDLNSTGGTFVNGQRTSQSVLYPGDVISLAGVALIFGQDSPPAQSGVKNTSPFKNQVSDRPTAVLNNEEDRSTAKFKLNSKDQ